MRTTKHKLFTRKKRFLKRANRGGGVAPPPPPFESATDTNYYRLAKTDMRKSETKKNYGQLGSQNAVMALEVVIVFGPALYSFYYRYV